MQSDPATGTAILPRSESVPSEPKVWHQVHASGFGNKIPASMAEFWTGIFAAKGFDNSTLTEAVIRLAMLPVEDRPEWPLEHIQVIERLSGQILAERALAGQLGPKDLSLAIDLAKQSFLRARSNAQRGVGGYHCHHERWHPESGWKEAIEYRKLRDLIERLFAVTKSPILEHAIKKANQDIYKEADLFGWHRDDLERLEAIARPILDASRKRFLPVPENCGPTSLSEILDKMSKDKTTHPA